MTHPHEIDHVNSRGTLRCDEFRVEYYTTNPAPNQWAAIGVLFTPDAGMSPVTGHRLIVGNGACERSAVADLQNIFARSLSRAHLSCEIVTEFALVNPATMAGESPAHP